MNFFSHLKLIWLNEKPLRTWEAGETASSSISSRAFAVKHEILRLANCINIP